MTLLSTDASTTFTMAKRWITLKFTWLYIGSQDVWAIVIIIIYFSKYGSMKLGKNFHGDGNLKPLSSSPKGIKSTISKKVVWSPIDKVLNFTHSGKDTDVPEYNSVTWFTMLFACGVGVGMFFFGVSEPIYHYTGSNRWQATPDHVNYCQVSLYILNLICNTILRIATPTSHRYTRDVFSPENEMAQRAMNLTFYHWGQ